MKTIAFSTFKGYKTDTIKSGECLRVTSDGDVIFYAVVTPQGEMRHRVEGICSQIDASAGSVPDDVGPTPVSILVSNYRRGAVADPAEARTSLLALGVSDRLLLGEEEPIDAGRGS